MLKLLAALFILLLPIASMAQPDPDCNPSRAPFVNVKPVFDDPAYNFETGFDVIQQLARDSGHSIHESLTLGLTHYESKIEFRLPVETTTYPDGHSCSKIKRADVDIGYKNVVVYVAREIPQGTCGFDEVVAHEQKHIAVNRRVLAEYAPQIQQSLEAYLKDHSVIMGQDRDAEIARLRQNLQNLLDNFGERMSSDNVARQTQIDNPGEYKRLSRVCNGQLGAIVARTLRENR